MTEKNYQDKYLETKHGWDCVNQTLKSIIKNKDEVDKEQIIKLLEECTAYFKEKVVFGDVK